VSASERWTVKIRASPAVPKDPESWSAPTAEPSSVDTMRARQVGRSGKA